MSSQPRRHFLRNALGMIPMIYLAPAALRDACAAETCAEADSESLRASLHYQVKASDPQKECSACSFFTAGSASGCGECQIMSGPVDATGHCDSWSSRS